MKRRRTAPGLTTPGRTIPGLAAALLLATALPLVAQTAGQEAPAAESAAPAATAPATEGAAGAQAQAPAAPEPVEASGTYAFDPNHTHIVWSYEHMGFSTSTGVIRGVTGSVTLDPADPAASTVEASFPLSALQSVSPELDRHLIENEEFFAGAPADTAITFRSTAVEPTGDTTARVTGDLTLNGQTRPVTLDVTLRQSAVNPIDKVEAVGFQATGTLKRSDFGLGAFAPAVSDEVEITINAEGHKG